MPRQRPCCARRCARARARALLRMQLCSSVLLRSVVDLVPCRSHQLFAALLHGHARAEEATERSHRRSRRSPRSRLPLPPDCHHHTGLQEDTEGASRVREGLVVNNHNFLDEIESTFSDRESTLGLASGGRLPQVNLVCASTLLISFERSLAASRRPPTRSRRWSVIHPGSQLTSWTGDDFLPCREDHGAGPLVVWAQRPHCTLRAGPEACRLGASRFLRR